MGTVSVNPPPDLAAAQRQAARLAAKADIRDVRLMSTCAKIAGLPGADSVLTYNLDSDANVEYEPGTSSFVVRSTYRLFIAPADPAGRPPTSPVDSAIANIEFEQAALFIINGFGQDDLPPTADELRAYAVTTGQFAIHPYAREYIYDVTGRLGLPPLTVGVLMMPWNEANNAASQKADRGEDTDE
jgi:hypothetical protein